MSGSNPNLTEGGSRGDLTTTSTLLIIGFKALSMVIKEAGDIIIMPTRMHFIIEEEE